MTTTTDTPTAIAHLTAATHEVFETMIMASLTTGAPIEGDALRPRSNVVGTVSFTGSESGVVAFYATFAAAKEIAAAMLGGPVEKVEEIGDAIGELTNMIAGTFRNAMVKDGASWAISIPSVTIGSDFYTKYVSDVRRVLCPFRVWDEELFVELIVMRQSESR